MALPEKVRKAGRVRRTRGAISSQIWRSQTVARTMIDSLRSLMGRPRDAVELALDSIRRAADLAGQPGRDVGQVGVLSVQAGGVTLPAHGSEKALEVPEIRK